MNSLSGEMAERLKAPVLKTGDVKASVGSNPTLSAKPHYMVLQKYPSGRRGSPAKGVGGLKTRARVRLPPSAPNKASGIAGGFIFLFRPYKFRLYHTVQIPLCISLLII